MKIDSLRPMRVQSIARVGVFLVLIVPIRQHHGAEQSGLTLDAGLRPRVAISPACHT